MDISYLETLTLSHLPEEASEMAQQLDMELEPLQIHVPDVLNEEEMAIFAEVGQVTLYHP